MMGIGQSQIERKAVEKVYLGVRNTAPCLCYLEGYLCYLRLRH